MSIENSTIQEIKDELLTVLRNNSTNTIMFHQAIATKLGLNPTDHKCLEIILKNPSVTAGKIAELIGLSTGAVTGVIDRLEKVGFVYRDSDPNDRRRTIIRVSEKKAEEAIFPLFGTFGEKIEKVLAKYKQQELELLIDFFNNINEVLIEETERIKKLKK